MQKEWKDDRLSDALGHLSVRPSNRQASSSPYTSSQTPAIASGSGPSQGLKSDPASSVQGDVQINAVRPPARRQQLPPPPPPPPVVESTSVASVPLATPSHLLANVEWTFVEEPKDMFECGICALVLSEPHLPLCCCQSHVCLKCVDKWRAMKDRGTMEANCPFCNTPEFQTRLNVDLKNQVLDLEVRCLYHKDGCHWMGKLGDAELHVMNDCKFLPVCCPNGCSTPRLQRRHLEHHMMQCGHAVVQCPFKSIGCSDVIKRQDIPIHLQQRVHSHLKEVSAKTTAAFSSSSAHLEELKAKYESHHEAQERDITRLTEKITQVQATVVALEEELRDGREKIDALRNAQERITAHSLTELRGRGERFVRLRDTHLALDGHIQALPAAKVATGFIIPPVLFTIDNFSKRRINNGVWYSPPFYTHSAGYKMCISVYPNGCAEKKGVDMSVYIHFMEGEYDEHLQWPFEGLVTVVLLNQQRFIERVVSQKTSTNYYQPIFLDKERSFDCRLRVDANEGYGSGWGYGSFIPLKDLGMYLTSNDSLVIKVSRIIFLPL